MQYENLTQQELIILLQEKDKTIENIQTKLEESYEHIEHFISDKHYIADIMDSLALEVYKESDIDFSALLVETEEADNSKDIDDVESKFSSLIDYSTSLSDSIFSFREDKFKEAITDLNYCIDNDIPYYLPNFNFPSYLDLEYTSSSRYKKMNYSYKLTQFIGKVPAEQLHKFFSTDKQLFTFFDFEEPEHVEEVNKLIKNLLSDEPCLFSFKNKNIEEKKKILIEHFPKALSAIAAKERDMILDKLADESSDTLKIKKRI